MKINKHRNGGLKGGQDEAAERSCHGAAERREEGRERGNTLFIVSVMCVCVLKVNIFICNLFLHAIPFTIRIILHSMPFTPLALFSTHPYVVAAAWRAVR